MNGYSLHIATLLLGFAILVLTQVLPTENLRLGSEGMKELNSGWTLTYENQVFENQQIPVDINLKPGNTYTASRILDADFSSSTVLRIRSSMQELAIYLNGSLLYGKDKRASEASEASEAPPTPISRLAPPPASVWHLVRIPSGSGGKELMLQMSSPVAAFSGTINPIYYGPGEALLYDLVNKEFFGILISFGLMFIGIILLAASQFLRQLTDRRFLHLGLFAVSMSLWILSEARVLQLFTGNRFLIGSLSYVMVTYIPIPLIFYLRDIVLTGYKRILNVFSLVFAVLLMVNLSLQTSGIANLIETLPLTLISLIVLAGIILFLLFREAFGAGNIAAQKFLLYAAILVIFMFMEVAAFFFHGFNTISSFLRIGIFIFFVFLVFDSIRYINELLAKKKEAAFYEEMAFKDILTGGFNRNAFEREVDKLIKDPQHKEFRLVLMDLNDLKLINDTYGHKSGDQALELAYSAIDTAFSPYGMCYRVSGDEFACIMFDIREEIFAAGIVRMRAILRDKESEVPYRLGIASGSNIYKHAEQENFISFYHEIDSLMYQDKKRLKRAGRDIPL